jgi:hypothetical protein
MPLTPARSRIASRTGCSGRLDPVLPGVLPEPLIARTFFLRGVRLWLGTRAAILAASLMVNEPVLWLDATGVVIMIGVAVAVCFLAVRRNHERALLGNLGLSPFVLAALFAVPAVMGETLVSVLERTVR